MPVYGKKLGNSHHEHGILFKRDIGLYQCNGCREFGFDAGFICESCNFVLHDQCAVEFNRNITVPHFDCNFILLSRVNDVICYVCNAPVKGYAYFSTNGDCEVITHPPCAKLPRLIKTGHDGVVLELSKDIKSKCFWCNQRKLRGTKTNWGYASKGTIIHVRCVRELFVWEWQTGTIFSPSNYGRTNCSHTNNRGGASSSNNIRDFKPRRSHVEVVGENSNKNFFSCIPDKVQNLVTIALALIYAILGLKDSPALRRHDPQLEPIQFNTVELRQLECTPALSTNIDHMPKHTCIELDHQPIAVAEQMRKPEHVRLLDTNMMCEPEEKTKQASHRSVELHGPEWRPTLSEAAQHNKQLEFGSSLSPIGEPICETKPKNQFFLIEDKRNEHEPDSVLGSTQEQSRETEIKSIIISATAKIENELQLNSENYVTMQRKREHENVHLSSSTMKQMRESEAQQSIGERGREQLEGHILTQKPKVKTSSAGTSESKPKHAYSATAEQRRQPAPNHIQSTKQTRGPTNVPRLKPESKPASPATMQSPGETKLESVRSSVGTRKQ